MFTTKLKRAGPAVALDIPSALLKSLAWGAGTNVALAVKDGCLVVCSYQASTSTLDQLIAGEQTVAYSYASSAEDGKRIVGLSIPLEKSTCG